MYHSCCQDRGSPHGPNPPTFCLDKMSHICIEKFNYSESENIIRRRITTGTLIAVLSHRFWAEISLNCLGLFLALQENPPAYLTEIQLRIRRKKNTYSGLFHINLFVLGFLSTLEYSQQPHSDNKRNQDGAPFSELDL